MQHTICQKESREISGLELSCKAHSQLADREIKLAPTQPGRYETRLTGVTKSLPPCRT